MPDDRDLQPGSTGLGSVLDALGGSFESVLDRPSAEFEPRRSGTVVSVRRGVARVVGLRDVRSDELLVFDGGVRGLAFDLDADAVSVVLLDDPGRVGAGAEARGSRRVLDVPVGEALRGRVVDPLGRPLDGHGPIRTVSRAPIERRAPRILDRMRVRRPLHTGVKVIDALFPIGRGQRELILGDRQTGKTALALDAILAQRDPGGERERPTHCIYCAIGQRTSGVAKRIAMLEREGALDYTTVVVADAEAPPGLQFIAPFAATSIAEWSMERGEDALIVYDDLTRHAWAYRELSLLLERPPGREAYPGDIFYLHARLLERATQLRSELGGGSLTALPILETEAEDIAAYIPTNLISITDGQLFLSSRMFRKGLLPAVDIGKSVSRVGGKAQRRGYRDVAARMRLVQSQFEELEVFARFGTQLEEETLRRLARGERVRELLRQVDAQPIPLVSQIAAFLAVDRGFFDADPIEDLPRLILALQDRAADRLPRLREMIERDEAITDPVVDEVRALVEQVRRSE